MRVITPDGFPWLPLVVPDAWRDLVHSPLAVSEIVRRGIGWCLMLSGKTEDVPSLDGQRFGLDAGLASLAVLPGPGIVWLFDGKPLRYARGRFFPCRQTLQRKRELGMAKRGKGREPRWARCENHRASRHVVGTVAAAGGVLRIEKLPGIRDRTKKTRKVNRMLHAWPFARLLAFVRYEAASAGVEVVEGEPRHAYRKCSR